jgi:hypothetical protein
MVRFLPTKIKCHAPHCWVLEIEQHTSGKPSSTRIEPAVQKQCVTAKRKIEFVSRGFCSLTPGAGLVLPAGWWLAGFGFLAVGISEKLATYCLLPS